VLIRDGAHVHILPVDSVDYAQAQDDYVSIRSGGRAYLKEQTLADLEASLDPGRFVRIHRSYLLNIERLVRVDQTARESRAAILKDGTRLHVSRTRYTRIQQLLGL
jgi:two-component system LytT family response regulator